MKCYRFKHSLLVVVGISCLCFFFFFLFVRPSICWIGLGVYKIVDLIRWFLDNSDFNLIWSWFSLDLKFFLEWFLWDDFALLSRVNEFGEMICALTSGVIDNPAGCLSRLVWCEFKALTPRHRIDRHKDDGNEYVPRTTPRTSWVS